MITSSPPDQLIPSPFGPVGRKMEITTEQLEQIKKILGAECIMIVIAVDKHTCKKEECPGHPVHSAITGFDHNQYHGLLEMFGNTCPFEGGKSKNI